jgi:dopamine beta-monooxygenase
MPMWDPMIDCYPSYQNEIPNGKRVKDCEGEPVQGVGHVDPRGDGRRNNFGLDFRDAGRKWTPELCNRDSDGDGVTNGVELGDPECVWSKGKDPAFDMGITHPGENCKQENCDGSYNETNNTDETNKTMLTGCNAHVGPHDRFVDFTFPKNKVPYGTAYLMQAFTWPEEWAGAVVRFDFINNQPNVVHHMILYSCGKDQSEEFGNPGPGVKPEKGMVCQEAVMAWAKGGGPFCTPKNVAFVVEPKKPFFILEMHYDNPRNEDVVDDSGVRLHYAPYDEGSGVIRAGVILGGVLTKQIHIPPGHKQFHVSGRVSSLRIGVKADKNATIFAYTHHMHKIGRKQWATLVDGKTGEAEEFACITNYDFDLQETTSLTKFQQLREGQRLDVDCIYDSRGQTETIHGGEASDEEMCIFVAMYYPEDAVKLWPQVTGDLHQRVYSGPNKICSCPQEFPKDAPDPFAMFIAHSGMMLVAWAFVLPIGAGLPLSWRKYLGNPTWFEYHQRLQTIGLVASLVGVLTVVGAMGGLHFSNEHHRLGFFVMTIGIIQGVYGYLRPHKPSTEDEAPSESRRTWLISHRIIALVALLASQRQIYTGIRLLFRRTLATSWLGNIEHALLVLPVLSLIWFIGVSVAVVFVLVGWHRSSRADASKAGSGIEAAVLSNNREDLS